MNTTNDGQYSGAKSIAGVVATEHSVRLGDMKRRRNELVHQNAAAIGRMHSLRPLRIKRVRFFGREISAEDQPSTFRKPPVHLGRFPVNGLHYIDIVQDVLSRKSQ